MPVATRSVAVIVARFQVPTLHEGHRALIKCATSQCANVLVVLGDHGGLRTDHDPLTFNERKEMVLEQFPHVRVERLYDHPWSSSRWSVWLDTLIERCYPKLEPLMFGSRNSFLSEYDGKFKKIEIPYLGTRSGTEVRRAITYSPAMSAREAIIYHEQHRHPNAYSTADIAVIDRRRQQVLAGTKPRYDGKYSLLGGFVDPKVDSCDRATAQRELSEECPGVIVGPMVQLGERVKIDDPRYRKAKDKIYTTLFGAEYLDGVAVGGDDITGVRWISRNELQSDLIVPWHHPLGERIEAYWAGK